MATAWQFLRVMGRNLGPPILGFCLAGMVFGLVRVPLRALLVVTPLASYYLFTIQLWHVKIFPRITLPAVPLLAVCGGILAGALLRSRSWVRWVGVVMITVGGLYGTLRCLNYDLAMIGDTRYRAEAWLQQHVGADETVGVFASDEYLPRLDYLRLNVARYPEEDVRRDMFDQRGPAYLLITSRQLRERDDEAQRFYRELLEGSIPAYRIVWAGWRPPPLAFLLGDDYIYGVVNSRVWILERHP